MRTTHPRALAASIAALLTLLGALAVATLVATSGAPAQAIDKSKGYPGFCKDDVGVTVVIDFQQLGGKTIVRCNPRSTRGTGLDALLGSGIQVEGVQRWGLAFICRVENRPSAVETIPIKGNEHYKERCIDTPPASGYWSYWHAGNDCAWHYSQWGVKNRDFTPGGFEGWSFSLNATAETNPKPRIAAVRPGTEGGPCVEKDEPAPTTNDPNEQQPGSSADDGYQPDSDYGKDGKTSDNPYDPDNASVAPDSLDPLDTDRGNSADRGDLPAPRPRDPSNTADDPGNNVAFTGGQDAADVRDVIKKQVNASDLAPWVACGVMVLLALLALWTARRRRRAYDGT
jgi:hypothetical protein